MDISVDLILPSATPIKLAIQSTLSKIKPVQYDKSVVTYAPKKVAHITLSRDLGHAETAPSRNFFPKISNAIKL